MQSLYDRVVAFVAEQLYSLPQFAPVVRALIARGHRVTTLLRVDEKLRDVPLTIDLPTVDAHTLQRVDHDREGGRILLVAHSSFQIYHAPRSTAL